MSDRPWIAEWRSHMNGWNYREGSRFATESAAKARALHMKAQGCWDVRVVYAPVIKAAKEAERE